MIAKHIAILGAGPTGLEAALAASESGLEFTLYEAAESVAASVRSWGHVQLFTPWDMNVSPRARAVLSRSGLTPPSTDDCPTGAELVEYVLEPLARLPAIASRLRLGARVVDIGRDTLLKHHEVGTGARAGRPFRLLVHAADGSESIEHADVVLDCTGTYDNPNALGAGGIPAPGERGADSYIVRRIPDLEAPTLKGEVADWSGQRILLVGAGHSAQTAARDLSDLVDRVPSTTVTWAIRDPEQDFGEVEGDPLPARYALGRRARELAFREDTPFDIRLGRTVHALRASPDGIVVTLRGKDGTVDDVAVDRVLSLTGSSGDARMYRQLQVHECWATSGPMKLAAKLMAASSADCLDQESHGVDALRNPEPDFYILGSKSYGRNTTFLLRIGWEQVDEVFSLLNALPATSGVTS